MSCQQPKSPIRIWSITLSQSNESVNHIIFRSNTSCGRFEKEVSVHIPPGREHKEVFDPVLELSAWDKLSILATYRTQWLHRPPLSIIIESSEIMTKAKDDGHGKQVYLMSHKNIQITIVISGSSSATSRSSSNVSLPSTTSEIFRICPRFRLLIIGNSGVGKSTLIHKVFGVKDVNVCESSRGEPDINQEFVADNKLFVLHESAGLEAGESNDFDKIKDFIAERRKMTELKDRLHAVWVCIAVPYFDGRPLEAGIEQFLRDKESILGDTPIVVVVTKLDLLDASLIASLSRKGTVFKSLEEAMKIVEPRRYAFLEKNCVKPVKAAGGSIPLVAVSTGGKLGLEPTILQLVKITTSQIEQYIQADPSYVALSERQSIERSAPLFIARMAQRTSIKTIVQTAIEVGKKRYWKNLGASSAFSDKKVRDCLLVIHEDIVRVWSFNDPELALQDEKFYGALLDTSNLKVQDIQDPNAALRPAMPLLSVLGPLVEESAGLANTFPVAGVAILSVLRYEVYKSTQTIAKRFMAYIVDLMYVMKILFVLVPDGIITTRDVALAFEVYEKSTYRNRIHSEIGCFSTDSAMVPGGHDVVLAKIEELIGRFNITDEEA